MTETATQTPRAIKVHRNELPLACPRRQDTLWSMHPRVFLSIEKTGQATCPYCGAQYVLED